MRASEPDTPPQHGGARTGSGVKPSDGAHGLRPVTVSLDAATIAGAQALAHALGGSVSVGLRRAVAIALDAAAQKHNGP